VTSTTRRNETPHSGVLTGVTAEGGKQNQHPEANLDSGIGSEEDGVENRSDPQGWLTDGSPGDSGSTPDADLASVKTVPPMFGVGPAGTKEPGGKDPAAPAPAPDDETPDFPERKPWDPRIPDSPAPGNGSSGSSGSAAPAGWPPSPASASADAASAVSSSGPGAPPVSDRYSPADSSFGSDTPYRPDGSYGAGSSYGSDTAYGTGTSQFRRPAAKGKVRPARPAKAPKGPQNGGQRSASFPTQGAGTSRKAQLAVSRIEPWSVMKFSFMISLVGWVILFVAVAVMYFVVQKLGVFTSIEHTVGLVTSTKNKTGTNAASWFKASRVLGYTMLVGAVNVVLITALSTIGAVLYNLITMVAGGIEITLKEAE
jgi:hypothetical protein